MANHLKAGHIGPYPLCKHGALRALKGHLREIRGGVYDDHHPQAHPESQRLDDSAFLATHTRRRNLIKGERKYRRFAPQKLRYERPKTTILDKAKNNHDREKDSIRAAAVFASYTYSASKFMAQLK